MCSLHRTSYLHLKIFVMILKRLLAFVFVFVVHNAYANDSLSLASPSHVIEVSIYHQPDGQVQYGVYYKRKLFIKPSGLAIRLKNPDVLLNKFDLVKSGQREFNETWKPVWGEVGSIKNNYQELTLQFKDKSGSGILLNIIFRAFDDGIGFRYEFPQQEKLNHFIVADEMTQFSLGADHTVFWIPGDFDTNEFKYNHTKLSEVDASSSAMSQEIAAKTFFDKNAVQTPLMMKTAEGLYINIHEAALVNYPAMDLVIDKSSFGLSSHLVPDAVGNKAYLQAPAKTPWRTIVVSDKAADILASRLILNLNEPSKVRDVSWIKPQKYVGIWWKMHVGKSSWNYA